MLPARADPTPSTAPAYETVVRSDAVNAGPVATTLPADDARRVPGIFNDPLRAVEAIAGVARTALGSGQLVVWGAAPAESRILFDGIEVPALYHLGGLRTILPAAMVKDLTLLPGGYGAEYGRALGGLLLVSGRSIPDGLHGEVSADLLDASASLSAAIGKRLRVMIAGRYSYFDRTLTALFGQELTDFFPLPRYYDFQLRATLALRKDEQLTLTILGASDELRRAHAPADAAQAQTETWRRTFYRIGLRYERRLAEGAQIAVTPWVGFDTNDYQAAFGITPAQLASRELRYGLRANYTTALGSRLALTVGLDVLGSVADLTRAGTLSRPAREGPFSVRTEPGYRSKCRCMVRPHR